MLIALYNGKINEDSWEVINKSRIDEVMAKAENGKYTVQIAEVKVVKRSLNVKRTNLLRMYKKRHKIKDFTDKLKN